MSDLAFLEFDALVARAVSDPSAALEAQRRFGTRAAILVVDFTGMVTRTDARGIIYALGRAMQAQAAMGLSGTRVKRVADTLFLLYPTPAAALLDALAGQTRLAAAEVGSDDPIGACMGLGFGDCLLIPAVDVFGAEVNRAFVLGEDVARGGEVLITDAFLSEAGSLPAGIGAFRENDDRLKEAGFGFHTVRDYR